MYRLLTSLSTKGMIRDGISLLCYTCTRLNIMTVDMYWLSGVIFLCLLTPGQGVVSLMSFNTGLTSRIPYLQERSRYTEDHVAQTNPDFVCLQEVCSND